MSKLFVIPTPIGNLEDITLRALRILNEVDVILAEDTRNSIHLLKHFKIEKRLQSYHQHNEHKILEQLVDRIRSGESMALISDAGTPGISDPGFLLIRECIRNEVEVETLPGATAFVPALVNSGLPCDRFVFEGFLPQKKGRHTRLQALKQEVHTIVIYESPYRLVKVLDELASVLGKERRASVSRELSKLHEENKRGTLEELSQYFKSKTVKGEIVVVVGGSGSEEKATDE